jgi:protocatechuate 3,4-dioxygenase beta subunit
MTGRRVSVHPPNNAPEYRSTALRAPSRPLRVLSERFPDLRTPLLADVAIGPLDGALIEVWQANAAGRYAHISDQHSAPLDPNFSGAGRTITDDEGRFRFVTIKPGAYPWRNHPNAWRPAHVHFSVFSEAFAQRLVTQMYFPGDPLLALDPLFNSVPDPDARQRLVARWSLELTQPEWSLGYEWDIVVAGRDATPLNDDGDE